MPPKDSLISLHFHEDFPDPNYRGTCVELAPDALSKVRIGRWPQCEIVLLATVFSRLHATIEWDVELQRWKILDGGFVEGSYCPSANGVWVNGRQAEPEDWVTIHPSSKVCLGVRAAKVFVAVDKNSTVLNQCWEQPGWPPDPGETKEAVIVSSQPNNPWQLAGTVWLTLVQPPKSWYQAYWLGFLSLLGALVAVAIAVAISR